MLKLAKKISIFENLVFFYPGRKQGISLTVTGDDDTSEQSSVRWREFYEFVKKKIIVDCKNKWIVNKSKPSIKQI